MKLKTGDKVTVKVAVLSYESRECPHLVGEVFLSPGEEAVVVDPKVPYVSMADDATPYFAFVRFGKFRTGLRYSNIVPR